jgi:hypothetical protein
MTYGGGGGGGGGTEDGQGVLDGGLRELASIGEDFMCSSGGKECNIFTIAHFYALVAKSKGMVVLAIS